MPLPVHSDSVSQQGYLSNRLNSLINYRKERGLYRSRRIVASPQSTNLTVDKASLLNFCSNDYLGLANDSRVKAACKRGIDTWGVGAGASHLVCGHTSAHHELEEALADFLTRESVLLFSSGYAANVGVINGLLGEGDCVFQDRLNHASLLDGGWISRAEHHWYEHKDYSDLEEGLIRSQGNGEEKTKERIQLVVSDGVFSMDGDECDLVKIVETAKKHSASVMIDDAHGIGCVGHGGTGIIDPNKITTKDVPILVGTLGKAFGTAGAFVAGDKALIDFLVQRARNYIYSTAMPSAIAVASLKSLEIVKDESWRREKLQDNIQYFHQCLSQLDGLKDNSSIIFPALITASKTAIQPIILGCAERASRLSQKLESNGILVSAIRPPTVPPQTSRLRITLNTMHSFQDIDRLFDILSENLS